MAYFKKFRKAGDNTVYIVRDAEAIAALTALFEGTQADTIQGKAEEFRSELDSTAQNTQENTTAINQNTANISDLQTTIDGLQTNIDSNSSSIEELVQTTSGLSATIEQNTNSISSLDVRLTDDETLIAQNSSQIESHQTEIDSIKSINDEQSERIESIQTSISSIESDVANANDSINSLTESVGNLSSSLSDLDERVETIENRPIIKLKGNLPIQSGETIEEALANIESPEVGDLYLTPEEDDNTQMAEYLYTVNSTWERLGTISAGTIDLSEYYTANETEELIMSSIVNDVSLITPSEVKPSGNLIGKVKVYDGVFKKCVELETTTNVTDLSTLAEYLRSYGNYIGDTSGTFTSICYGIIGNDNKLYLINSNSSDTTIYVIDDEFNEIPVIINITNATSATDEDVANAFGEMPTYEWADLTKIDDTPTESSSNLISSGAVYNALQNVSGDSSIQAVTTLPTEPTNGQLVVYKGESSTVYIKELIAFDTTDTEHFSYDADDEVYYFSNGQFFVKVNDEYYSADLAIDNNGTIEIRYNVEGSSSRDYVTYNNNLYIQSDSSVELVNGLIYEYNDGQWQAVTNASSSDGSLTVNVKYYTAQEIIDQYSIDGDDTTSPIFIDDDGNEWQYEYDDSNSDGYQLWFMNGERTDDDTPPDVPLRLKENGEQDVETALRDTNKSLLNKVDSSTYETEKSQINENITTNRTAIENLPCSRAKTIAFGKSAGSTTYSNINYSKPTSSSDLPLYVVVAVNANTYVKKLIYSDFDSSYTDITWQVNDNLTIVFSYNYSTITSITATSVSSVNASVTFIMEQYSSNAIGQAVLNAIEGSNESSISIDQTYDATSTNAQSGVAVAQALETVSSKTFELLTPPDSDYSTYGYLYNLVDSGTDLSGTISDWSSAKGVMITVDNCYNEKADGTYPHALMSVTYDTTTPNTSASDITDKKQTFVAMKHPASEILKVCITAGAYGERLVSRYFTIKIDTDGEYTISCPYAAKEDSDSESTLSWDAYKIRGIYVIY